MRAFLPLGVLFSLILLGNLYSEELPRFRPAVLGTGPKSLVNLINTDSLMKKGQGDATVMFECFVSRQGEGWATVIDGRTTGSGELEKELFFRLENRALFVPAIYEHKKEEVILYGTVVFKIIKGKPHLRIFLNQEAEDLRHGNDFIAPQNVLSVYVPFRGIIGVSRAETLNARIDASLDIDETGKVKDVKVINDSHPDLGLGPEVVRAMHIAPFIPGFRNGKPADCT